MSRKKLGGRELTALTAAFAFAGLANLHWLYPFFKFLPLKIEDPATTFFQGFSSLQIITDLLPVPPAQPFWGMSLLRLGIVAAGILGIKRMMRDRNDLLGPLMAGLLFFGALAYFGSLLPPLRHLQPYRYVSAYFYFWLPAAGYGLKVLHEKSRTIRAGEFFSPVIFCLALAALLRFSPTFLLFSAVAPLTTELDKDSQNLVAWVREDTDRSARLLIEDINVWDTRPGEKPLYGGARLVHLLPLLAPRELIGGPLPNAFIKHHHAGFHDGRFLGRPIGEFSDVELDEAFRLYNIGWAVAWTEESKARLLACPEARPVGTFGRLQAFKIGRAGSFFLEGSGEVSASFNRIHLGALSSDTGRVVISYHWVDGLVSDPPAKLTQVMIGDDPVGFIGIENPPEELTIRLGH